ncbi:MAG: acyl-CoA thioesterase [Nitrospirae bacterium]|nr:acyl-CoA thioesterase [Nitrospirota bacterium]
MTRKTHHVPAEGVETTFRVRYAETDGQGIVYSSHYLVWFEIGRTEWCRRAGIDYRKLEEEGYLLVVTEATCRYLSPARYDDEVVVRTRLASGNRRQLQFDYDLRLLTTGKRIATGATTHLWLDRAGKPIVLPTELRRLFEV